MTMRFAAVAFDYDGTLANDSHVDKDTIAALESLRKTGRKLILVTGRELPELRSVCNHLDLFDRIVAENGALLFRPTTGKERLLAQPPPSEFLLRLREAKVEPISMGRVIVATRVPHEAKVVEVIREMGLELQVIFNREAVMVLPASINKATGLAGALQELGLTFEQAVGCGDGENDHAFLNACALGVAVGDAVPALQREADLVMKGANSAGAMELARKLMTTDLDGVRPRARREQRLGA
jgi:hydroxymethylpyrimidine pyrophosphatase-like HAD family hydrolase